MTPPRAAPTPWARLARLSLAQWMLLAAAGGVACGLLAPGVASSLGIVTDIFLRLIRAIVAPVLVGVLIRAVGSAGSLGDLGRLGWKSLLLFELFTTVALLLGWGRPSCLSRGGAWPWRPRPSRR